MRTGKLGLLAVAGWAALMPLVMSCGISQGDYDSVNQRLAAKEKEAALYQQQLDTQGKQLADAQQKLKQASQAPTILGAVPNAPPPPTAVPAAPGAPTPVPPVPPEARLVPLYAHVDTVTSGLGESVFKVDATVPCVKTGQFARGMRIVWRMEIVDTTNGKVLQANDVKDALLRLPQSDPMRFRFGRHGSTDTSPWFWSTAWDVPMNYPLGALDYSISIETVTGKTLTIGDPLTMTAPERKMDTRLMIVPLATGI